MRRTAMAVALTAVGTLLFGGFGHVYAASPFTPPVATGPLVTSTDGGFGWSTHPVGPEMGFAEPSIEVGPSGIVFVTAPGGGGVQLWRSKDNGATFDHRAVTSTGGGGDSEVEFLRDGTSLIADLRVFDSAVSRSIDNFESSDQRGVGTEQDRQWLGHRCNDLAVLAYHDFAAEGVFLQRSTDGGKTWTPAQPLPGQPVSPDGTAPGDPGSDRAQILPDQGVNTFQGPVAVDQATGDVYVVFAISSAKGNVTTGVPPFGDPQQIVVGVSHDQGVSFKTKLVKAGGSGALAGVIFPWVTIDKAGNVYVSYAGRENGRGANLDTFLISSTTHGESWSNPKRINRDSGHAHVYTSMSAGDPGVVNMAWYTASTADPNDTTNNWFVDFAQVTNATSDFPAVSQSRVNPSPIHHGDICLNGLLCAAGGDRSLLDFFQVQTGPDGQANIAYANNFDANAPKQKGKTSVWYARQASGPSAGNGRRDLDPGVCGNAGSLTGAAIPEAPSTALIALSAGGAVILIGAFGQRRRRGHRTAGAW